MADPEILWQPSPDVRARTRIGSYLESLAGRGRHFAGYDELWRWSVDDLEGFWASVWEFGAVRSSTPLGPVLTNARMPGATWFPGARLNWAEHAIRLAHRAGSDEILVAHSESRGRSTLTVDELREGVARARAYQRPVQDARPDLPTHFQGSGQDIGRVATQHHYAPP